MGPLGDNVLALQLGLKFVTERRETQRDPGEMFWVFPAGRIPEEPQKLLDLLQARRIHVVHHAEVKHLSGASRRNRSGREGEVAIEIC